MFCCGLSSDLTSRRRFRQITTTQRRSILQIREVFSEDSGQFSCIASNRGGKAKCSANLVVERKQERGVAAPPNFVQTIQDTTVKAGKLARFDAKLAGTKPMDVYWLKVRRQRRHVRRHSR